MGKGRPDRTLAIHRHPPPVKRHRSRGLACLTAALLVARDARGRPLEPSDLLCRCGVPEVHARFSRPTPFPVVGHLGSTAASFHLGHKDDKLTFGDLQRVYISAAEADSIFGDFEPPT